MICCITREIACTMAKAKKDENLLTNDKKYAVGGVATKDFFLTFQNELTDKVEQFQAGTQFLPRPFLSYLK